MLPCDIVCELEGLSLLEAWMVQEAGFGGASGGYSESGQLVPSGIGGEQKGRRGGLGVWYSTKQVENAVKGEQTDFIATTPLEPPLVPPPRSSLRQHLEEVVISMPTDSLNDIVEANKGFPMRHGLLRRFSQVKMRSSVRDAHIYFFPYWIKDMVAKNNRFDSIGEDVVGWWAKAGWQVGLGEKLGLREVLQPQDSQENEPNGLANSINPLPQEVDVASYSTTCMLLTKNDQLPSKTFASRVQHPSISTRPLLLPNPLTIPSILAYIQPTSESSSLLIRRVDTAELLRHVSLLLAKQPSTDNAGASSPFAHPSKIAHPESLPKQCRVESENSLLDANVTVAEKVNIKQCVIGTNCSIGSGSRLQGCVLMEGVTVGENVQLSDCILGPRSKIEGGARTDADKTVLKNCEVQGNFIVPWGSKSNIPFIRSTESSIDNIQRANKPSL